MLSRAEGLKLLLLCVCVGVSEVCNQLLICKSHDGIHHTERSSFERQKVTVGFNQLRHTIGLKETRATLSSNQK